MTRAVAVAVAVACLSLPLEAQADPGPPGAPDPLFVSPSGPVYALRGDPGRDLGIALAVGGMVGLSEVVFKKRLAPTPARWNDRTADGADVLNALDRSAYRLRWIDPQAAGRLSDFGLFAAAISALSLTATAGQIEGQRSSESALDVAVVAESAAVAMALNQATKFLAGRERPCKHYAQSELPCGPDRHDENLSSFSGHTSLVSSLTFASATVALMRGYALAPLLFGSGALFTLGTGYLRIAASKHYLTDVVVGAVLGSAIGVLMPTTFHGRISAPSTNVLSGAAAPGSPLSSALGGATFGFSGAF